jgi:hypothetical protein
MERIGSAVLGIIIIAIGGLMIVVPQFVEVLRELSIYFIFQGLFVVAFGVFKLVNGIEGVTRARLEGASTTEGPSSKTEPANFKFVPMQDLLGQAAAEARAERRSQDENKK